MMKEFDGRTFTNFETSWRDIKTGDVVLEGDDPNFKYRTITTVDLKYWEYFEDGYYKSTSHEYCHQLVVGQPGCDGELIKIVND